MEFNLKLAREAIQAAMVGLGAQASVECDLGRSIDDIWNELDDLLQTINNGDFNAKGDYK